MEEVVRAVRGVELRTAAGTRLRASLVGQRTFVTGLDVREWHRVYEDEAQRAPLEPGILVSHPSVRVFGTRQPCVPLDHRGAIAKWMCDTAQASRWTAATFFAACHAFDSYVLLATHQLSAAQLGTIAAACLYCGAKLRESSSDANIMTLDRFRALCPDGPQNS
eukprot:Protomagalhaensia_sp_Gyna_25__5755@NODE_833_length_2539_cov_3_244000_g657_i0_p2_GENE_NODE_833_length_2539_cov_3_244000_g657_i0NODE_833_length_2539_cov_3_244000_g657_i0_p2_ORF_typecomplete_len164_score13_67Cyclin_N/PF00134_23/3_2e07DUF5129/PF17173_4/0_041_NODE_833_length_2539_cov_3_244000_g657_i019510